jgi:choline-phosphate cytidylyltransferase
MSFPVSRSHSSTTTLSAAQSRVTTQHRLRHQAPPRIAAVLSSDSGVDSPTYDGDIESSSTAIAKDIPSANSSAGTPLASPSIPPSSAPDRRPPPALVLSRPADTNVLPLPVPEHPFPPVISNSKFNPASLTPDDIQLFVKAAIDGKSPRNYIVNPPPVGRPVRIYADGQ